MGIFAGIVGGAIKLGGKLIANHRAKKAARKAKRATKQAAKDQKLLASLDAARAAINNPGGVSQGLVGADEVAQSGNVLAMFKNLGGATGAPPGDLVTVADTPEAGGGFDFMAFIKTPWGMFLAAIALFVVLKKLKIIK